MPRKFIPYKRRPPSTPKRVRRVRVRLAKVAQASMVRGFRRAA